MVDLTIIIPTMDRQPVFEKTIIALLAAVKDLSFQTEIIVVNDSKSASPFLTEEQLLKIRMINNPRQGVASARNFGASKAIGRFLLFLDDDMLVKSENLSRTYQFLSENPEQCYAANWIYPPELTSRLQPLSFGRFLIHHGFISLEGWENSSDWNELIPYECRSLAATYFPIAKSSFDAIGGFDETFPFAGFEDYDLSVRLRNNGIRLFIDPLNRVFHNEEDRLDLNRWMLRKRRSAQTRRIGVERGYKEAAVNQAGWKYLVYFLNRPFTDFWIRVAGLVPNKLFFDPIYFKLVNFILGLNLHIGYFHSRKKSGYL